jgi:hypothetical protein
MAGGAFKVFVALHVIDYGSRHLLHFSSLAANAGKNVGKINQQLKLMGALGVALAGGAALGFFKSLVDHSKEAGMEIAKLEFKMRGLGLTAKQMQGAQSSVRGITSKHPAINTAAGLSLFKDTYSVLGDYGETQQMMPYMSKFMLAMKGAYGEHGDEKMWDAVRAAELQMGKNFNPKRMQEILDVYTKVVYATGGKVDPTQIHGMMKNMPYSRMAQSPEAIYDQLMLMMEMGGSRAGTSFQAMDRFVIGHATANGVSKQKLEKWAQYGLLTNVQRDEKGRISDYRVLGEEQYQKNKVDWLYNVYAKQLQKNGIDPYDPKSIPKIAQMWTSQVGAGATISTLLQKSRNIKEVGMAHRSYTTDQAAADYEKSDPGIFAGVSGAWFTLMGTLWKEIGPSVAGAAKALTDILVATNSWITQNPGMVKWFIGIGAGLAAIAVVAGTVAAMFIALPVEIAGVITAITLGVGALIIWIANTISNGEVIKQAWYGLLNTLAQMARDFVLGPLGIKGPIPGAAETLGGAAGNLWKPKFDPFPFKMPIPNYTGKAGTTNHNKISIQVNGAKDPKTTGFAVRDVISAALNPTMGFGGMTTPNLSHAYFGH